jgi:hypothetical protein
MLTITVYIHICICVGVVRRILGSAYTSATPERLKLGVCMPSKYIYMYIYYRSWRHLERSWMSNQMCNYKIFPTRLHTMRSWCSWPVVTRMLEWYFYIYIYMKSNVFSYRDLFEHVISCQYIYIYIPCFPRRFFTALHDMMPTFKFVMLSEIDILWNR